MRPQLLPTPRTSALVALFLLCAPTSAWAQTPGTPPSTAAAHTSLQDDPGRKRLRVNVPVDLSVTLGGGAVWILSEVLKPTLAPSQCHWCDPPGVDSSVRDSLRWKNKSPADTTSYVTGFALAPIGALGLDALAVHAGGGTAAEWGEDALVMLESIVVAANINQLVKFAVGRERPFVNALQEGEKDGTRQPSDNNLSFFSGHTTLAFSAAVSGGMIASLKGYKSAPCIWATGLVAATATGYLRIAADKHYFTDVLTGAVFGTAVGLVVPWLHRPSNDGNANAHGLRATGLS